MDSLRVTGLNEIVWRNLTGSGTETAGHLAQINRMTLMWCSFGPEPMILRTYGTARTLDPRDTDFAALVAPFAPHLSARQILRAPNRDGAGKLQLCGAFHGIPSRPTGARNLNEQQRPGGHCAILGKHQPGNDRRRTNPYPGS
jgi:hypothetical protein